MDLREFTRAYARSPLGIGSLFAALAAGGVAAILGAPPALSGLLALAALAAALAIALASGFGQRAATAELSREGSSRAAARVEAAAQARKRLASLRLAEPGLSSARDLLVLEAGRLIECCGREGTYDPEGLAAIGDSLELVDAWLREADENAVERRFELPDATPFPEAAAKTAQALREKALLIAARRSSLGGEISGADRIAIEEELK
jgi:hypothetical protein